MSKILLIHDVRTAAGALAWCLRRDGHQIIVATDGLRALSAARRHSPDLIILKEDLKNESGVQVASVLRSDERSGRLHSKRRVPIVLLAAGNHIADAEPDAMLMELSGVDARVDLAASPSDLLTQVHELADGRQRP